MHEVDDGGVPAGLAAYRGRLPALAAGQESASVRRSFATLRQAVPQAECRIAPGMHHAWNFEDVELFSAVVRAWVHGSVDERLQPA